MSTISKISAKSNSVNEALIQDMKDELAAGVSYAQAKYDDAKSAHTAKTAAVAQLVIDSQDVYDVAKASTQSNIDAIVAALSSNTDIDLNSLSELVAKINAQDTAISGVNGFYNNFVAAQNTATSNMIAAVGTLAEAEGAFDAAYGAGWDSAISL